MTSATTLPPMVPVVVTLLGDDRSGLVDAVASVVAKHGANWDRSHLAELAGKFAGIVLVTVPEGSVDALLHDLDEIEAQGLLAITAERSTAQPRTQGSVHVALELIGQDHPGIVHEISHLLASHDVSIDELETAVAPAPQGGNLFIAHAAIEIPAALTLDELRNALESVAFDLMVDLELIED